MSASIPPKVPPQAADLMAQLAAARGEVADAAAKSRALRKQMQVESLAQAALVAKERGEAGLSSALADDADALRRDGVDLKA